MSKLTVMISYLVLEVKCISLYTLVFQVLSIHIYLGRMHQYTDLYRAY